MSAEYVIKMEVREKNIKTEMFVWIAFLSINFKRRIEKKIVKKKKEKRNKDKNSGERK